MPVAVLGSEELDVNDIDVASIRLEGVAPVKSHIEDVSGPVYDGNVCDCNSSEPDGFADLVLNFRTPQVAESLVEAVGEPNCGDTFELQLTGQLADGTRIEGYDCVVVVGKVPHALRARKSDINGDGIVDLYDFGRLASHWLEVAAGDY